MNKIVKFAAITSAFLPIAAFAQTTPTSVTDLFTKLNTVVNWFAAIVFILATVFILVAAYKYLTAQGDPEKVKEAQNMLIYSVIGILVALLAYVVPGIVKNFIGGTLVAPPQ